MSAAQQPPLTRVMAHSARTTPNLAALGVSLALACVVGNAWVVFMGAWLYALLVARDSANGVFRRKVAELDAELARQLPAESTLTDPGVMLIVQALRKGFDEITRVMSETPDPVKPHLEPAVASLNDVRAQAVQLIRDADALSRYLLTLPGEATQAAIQRLNYDIGRSSDDSVKAAYQRALSVRQEQLAAVAHVTREHDRIVATLQFIVGTVEAFPAWIYRLRVLEARAKDDRIGDITDEIVGLKSELAASQQLLEGLLLDQASGEHGRQATPVLHGDTHQHHGQDRQ
jgi:hypothetical protein